MLDLKMTPFEEQVKFTLFPKYSFDPQEFNTAWLYREEIITKAESKNLSKISSSQDYMSYSSEFLNFEITPKSFTIQTRSSEILAYHFDITRSIASSISSRIRNDFDLRLNLHFRLKNAGKVKQTMKSLIEIDNYKGILNNIQSTAFQIEGKTEQKDFNFEERVLITPCGLKNGEKDIHIFLKNNIAFKDTIKDLNYFDEDFLRIVEKATKVFNFFIEKHIQL